MIMMKMAQRHGEALGATGLQFGGAIRARLSRGEGEAAFRKGEMPFAMSSAALAQRRIVE